MLNTLRIYDELKGTLEHDAAQKITEVISLIYEDLQNTVTKTEFKELRDVVHDLAEAQKRTEYRLEEFAEAQKELAGAQKRTEQRVNELAEAQSRTEQRLSELAEAQSRTEQRLSELAEAQSRTEQRVNELAEAQSRTEQRVNELAEAQSRTEQRLSELAEAQHSSEQRLGELAEAQKKTEEKLQNLIEEHQQTREHLGGLSMAFGYTLENEAYKKLPDLLKRDFNISIQDRLKRQYVTDNQGQKIEINIVGEASKNGQKIMIIGERKSQLSKNDVDRFIRKKLNRIQGVFKEIFVILITHMISSPEVEAYVKEKGFALYYSYDF